MTISSSWIVELGMVRPAGEPFKPRRRYRCSVCGVHGHTMRCCPTVRRGSLAARIIR